MVGCRPSASAAEETNVGFRTQWLAAFLFGSASDWLKGPYIYSLYQSYGYNQAQITLFFVTGYVRFVQLGLILLCCSYY